MHIGHITLFHYVHFCLYIETLSAGHCAIAQCCGKETCSLYKPRTTLKHQWGLARERRQSFKSTSPLSGAHPNWETGIHDSSQVSEPQELRQPGLPKGIHGTKGTKNAAACYGLPGADLGGPVVGHWVGRGLQHPQPKPRFLSPSLPSCGWQLSGAGLLVTPTGTPLAAGTCVLAAPMNQAVGVSPRLVWIGTWGTTCHSDFRADLDCKKRSAHSLPWASCGEPWVPPSETLETPLLGFSLELNQSPGMSECILKG